ncbi:hypothetical protein D5281_17290 [bacterium 1xD42-62]|uniref:Uncharacterized protein n=1 Tax=Parablautia muri TaxID=2320879 RepID=A0A9X5BIB5_9FIRM|nr:hypothetical protein [Parablautia muri]
MMCAFILYITNAVTLCESAYCNKRCHVGQAGYCSKRVTLGRPGYCEKCCDALWGCFDTYIVTLRGLVIGI